MGVMVNLSGGSGDRLPEGPRQPHGTVSRTASSSLRQRRLQRRSTTRTSAKKAARQLEHDVKTGARGLKIFKNLGMFVKDKDGKRMQTDDPRLDPVWDKCA